VRKCTYGEILPSCLKLTNMTCKDTPQPNRQPPQHLGGQCMPQPSGTTPTAQKSMFSFCFFFLYLLNVPHDSTSPRHGVVNGVLLPSIALNCLPECCTKMFNCSGILDWTSEGWKWLLIVKYEFNIGRGCSMNT
jgi:hypothetical protein